MLCVTADSPENLQRNLAELTGPLVLDLAEHSETEEEVRVAAALRWLQAHSGWFLILDTSPPSCLTRPSPAATTDPLRSESLISPEFPPVSFHPRRRRPPLFGNCAASSSRANDDDAFIEDDATSSERFCGLNSQVTTSRRKLTLMDSVGFHRLPAQEYRFALDWYRKREYSVAGRFREAVMLPLFES